MGVSLPRHRRVGDTVEFFFSEHCDLLVPSSFVRKALDCHGSLTAAKQTARQSSPAMVKTGYGRSGRTLKPIRIRQSQYLTTGLRRITGASSVGSAQFQVQHHSGDHSARHRDDPHVAQTTASIAGQSLRHLGRSGQVKRSSMVPIRVQARFKTHRKKPKRADGSKPLSPQHPRIPRDVMPLPLKGSIPKRRVRNLDTGLLSCLLRR